MEDIEAQVKKVVAEQLSIMNQRHFGRHTEAVERQAGAYKDNGIRIAANTISSTANLSAMLSASLELESIDFFFSSPSLDVSFISSSYISFKSGE